MFYQTGDGKYIIVRKLVELAGGTPQPGDPLNVLLGKYLTAIGGTYRIGDHFNVILADIVRVKGGTPTPGDHEWDLLVKWLGTLGECPRCGDSIHDLWKRILQAEVYVIPTDVVTIRFSSTSIHVTWNAPRDPATEWKLQIVNCADDSVLWDLTRLPDARDSAVVNFPNYPVGQWRARLRDADSPENAWVNGNCVIYPYVEPPLFSWVAPQNFFVSPTVAGGFLEVQHGPTVDGPFTTFLTGIATPGADYLLDFTGQGEPGGLWYRGRVSADQVNWSDWGTAAWDDNS